MKWFWSLFSRKFSRHQQSISSIKITLNLFEDETYIVDYEFPNDLSKEEEEKYILSINQFLTSIDNKNILYVFGQPLLKNDIDNNLFNHMKKNISILLMNNLTKTINDEVVDD